MRFQSESTITPVTLPRNTKSTQIPSVPKLCLMHHATLSGHLCNVPDEFADFSESPFTKYSNQGAYCMTSPVTPSRSTTFSETPSFTTISSWGSSQFFSSARSSTAPPTTLQQLQAQVHHLKTMMNAQHTARSLLHVIRLSSQIPMASILAEDVIPAVCNALSAHMASHAVCEGACRLISILAASSRTARRTALQHSALRLINHVISFHFSTHPNTIQLALDALGTLCLSGSPQVTRMLLDNRTFHWVFVAMRQWCDMPLIQTESLRVFSVCAKMDFEIAFHLVLSHAIFNELVTVLSNFAYDPFVVTHVFQTILSLIGPSSELRRISLCEDVFLHCTNAVSTHHTDCCVNLAYAGIASAYCVDQHAHLLVQRQGGVRALLSGLANARGAECRSKSSELTTSRLSLDITLDEDVHAAQDKGKWKGAVRLKNGGNGQNVYDSDESLSILPLTAIDDTLASFQALVAVCTNCDEACKEVLRCENVTIITDVVMTHSNDSNVIEACLALFTKIFKLPSTAEVFQAKAALVPIVTMRPEISMQAFTVDSIIRIARLTLYGHSSCRAPVALACSLLLFACQNGFQKLVLRSISHISRALERILRASNNDDAANSAFALSVLVC